MTFLVMNPQKLDVACKSNFPLSKDQTLGNEISHRANVLASKVPHRLIMNGVPVVNPNIRHDWYKHTGFVSGESLLLTHRLWFHLEWKECKNPQTLEDGEWLVFQGLKPRLTTFAASALPTVTWTFTY